MFGFVAFWFCCHHHFLFRQLVFPHLVIFNEDVVESVLQWKERIVQNFGLQQTFPYGNAVPSHVCQFELFFFVTTFVAIYVRQKSALLLGITKYLQSSWPCQKQPFTNITMRYFRNTIFGHPGNLGWFILYRKPWENKYLRTNNTGFVSLLRMDDIQWWRCVGVNLSISNPISFVLPSNYKVHRMSYQ